MNEGSEAGLGSREGRKEEGGRRERIDLSL
jgi:hypothetical protein